uniref:histone acetyltransferase n=1 Tax=Theileria annulata TaxID=5874 RepID=A0A3B0MFN7_THEAN
MECLKSSALIPGEPEYKSEFNLLNMLLMKVPKDVDLLPILNIKPLQPRHSSALQELHLELFPVHYDPSFFEVACSTECGFYDTQSFWDMFDSSSNNTRDLDWYENQILSFGLFLPRSYVSFFRKFGKYDIESYLEYISNEDDFTEFDDPLAEMLIFDPEYDEFLIGFVTLLINLEVTNKLISDDDYNILYTHYHNNMENNSLLSNEININLDKFDVSYYSFIYNQLYNNKLLIEYTRKFQIKDAKTIYILSTGITLGLRRRSLGTHLILFTQILIYFINYSIIVFEGYYYILRSRDVLDTIKNYYNKLFFKDNYNLLYSFYTLVLNDNSICPRKTTDELDSIIQAKLGEPTSNLIINSNCDQDSNHNSVSCVNNIPLVIYLHTIYYNEVATEMYKKLHFYNITTIPNYYSINNKKYNANFLAYFLPKP